MEMHTGASFQLKRKTAIPSPSGKPKTILRTKSAIPINIIIDGKNVTPRQLNPNLYRMGRERQISAVYEEPSATLSGKLSYSAATTGTVEGARSTLRFRTEMHGSASTVRGSIFHGTGTYLAPLITTDFLELTEDDTVSESDVMSRISSFELRTEAVIQTPPTHLSLILNETNTFFILDIPCCTALKDTEEGNVVEERNQEYQYLTEGKGRNRKVVNAETQTVQILKKTRTTVTEVIKIISDTAFSSNWEMYDTYRDRVSSESEESEDSEKNADLEFESKLRSVASEESFRMSSDERQLQKLMKNVRFLDAICIIERLLANNCFNEEQKRFRGLSDPDQFRDNIDYKYRLNLLWTFANDTTQGRCVTSIEWNPVNKDLLAVGYGKFYFIDTCTGVVMIWNIKNPVQPERTYHFRDPVTTLSFSTKDPNLLAIGFYNGRVIVINVVNREVQIIAENIPSFETVWSLMWRPNTDSSKFREQVCISSDDGRIIFYTLNNTLELQPQQMMRVAKADGQLKGFKSMRKCTNLNLPVSQYVGARFIKWHPEDSTIYFIGTNEGVVHKCSTNYLNQHLDLFLAHEGPINDLQYSPFSHKIYATCGDDWYLRIWATGIYEPLHELVTELYSVQGMDWSPTHSTILATICDKMILLWDFQRKVYKPQSETCSPSNSKNTIVQFIDSGRCLIVGDIDGNIHVFSLEDMPFPAFYQENLLFDALQNSLVTNPELVEKLKKLQKK